MSLDQALDRILGGGPFLLGVDFDGTLAPLVGHPDLATPNSTAVEALKSLAASENVDVVVVSGRALADLRERLGDIPGATLVGEHGNDVGGVTDLSPVVADAEELIRQLAKEAGEATVERKLHSVSFHYRHLDDEAARPFLTRIRDWAEGHDDLTVLEGKKVIEVSAASRNKGEAIMELAGERTVVYIGDDTTDETVFLVLRQGDLGIKVGEGPSAASCRVEDVGGVVRILERIALASR